MILSFLSLCFAVWALFWWQSRRRVSRYPLPPGPPGDPIIGHLRKIPSSGQEQLFHDWAKQYGDVIYLHCLGRSMIVLDSAQAADDLLNKRSAIYSCRPDFPMLKLMGWDPTLTLLPYGKQFMMHRRLLQQYLDRQQCLSYQTIQLHQARILVQNLLARPSKYKAHLQRFATAVVIKIAFGHDIESDDDIYVRLEEHITNAVNNSGPAGNTPVDFFPFLKYLPSWFPGAYYAHWARTWRWAVRKLHDYPFEVVKDQMRNGTAPSSFLASELSKLEDDSSHGSRQDQEDLKGAAGVFYAAGADTTSSALSIFMLAMVLHPDCQRKAQEELDTVVGPNRLPDFSDQEALPYIRCLVKETLRWYAPVHLGIPHRLVQDDVYRGMFLPKGSIVFSNISGMCQDETIYANPSRFDPTRFQEKSRGGAGEPDPDVTFGFGRRICPGRYLAEASLWIAIASILNTFEILKCVGEDGQEITPVVEFDTGVIHNPKEFKCAIKLRSPDAARKALSTVL